MKTVSNHSYAKTVHALKSIGKVLLPVALLLVAILCIGVAAGAEDQPIYTQIPGTMQHVKVVNGSAVTEDCSYSGPTCLETGSCLCGRTGMKNPNYVADSHVWVNHAAPEYVKTKGSCDVVSTYYKSCQNCGVASTATFTGSAGDAQHAFVIKDNKEVYTPADEDYVCDALVQYYYKCACGKYSYEDGNRATNETYTDTARYPHKTAHYNGETDVQLPGNLKVKDLLVSEPTCASKGVYNDYCSICGAVLTSTYEYGELGHQYVLEYNKTSHWRSCRICGAVLEGSEKLHREVGADEKATCSAAVTCDCGYVLQARLPHTLTKVEQVDATCDTAGTKAYWKCSVCKKLYSKESAKDAEEIKAPESIPALGHVAADPDAPACNPGVCAVCGKTMNPTKAHDFRDADGNESSSCDAVCKNCGTKKGTHEWKTQPTVWENDDPCTEKGKTWEYCKKCGDIRNEKEVAPVGHKFEGEVACFEKAVCTVCKKEITETHHVLPADFDPSTFKCTDTVICPNCGTDLAQSTIYNETTGKYELVPKNHELDYVDPKNATCTEDGVTAGYKCTCEVYINGVPYPCTYKTGAQTKEKLGHKWNAGEITVAPTCQTKGVKTFTCTRCRETRTEEVAVNPDAHKMSTNYQYTSDKHWESCTVQGCTYTTELTAHDYGDSPATCTASATCKVCGYVKAALGHKYAWVATETEHYQQCTRSDCPSIKTTGSAYINEQTRGKHNTDGYDATCTYVGYTKGCSVCKKWHAEDSDEIKMKAHSWTDWVYRDNGATTYDKRNDANTDKTNKNQYHVRWCTVCHKFESHKAVSDGKRDCITDGCCKTCGLTLLKNDTNSTKKEPAYGHTFTANDTVITATEHSWTCSRCGLVVSEKHSKYVLRTLWVYDQKSNSYYEEEYWFEAEDCQDGICFGCGYVTSASKAHTPGEDVWGDKSTHTFTCTVCGDEIVSEPHTIAAGDPALTDCTMDLRCSVCYMLIREGADMHEFTVSVPGVPATCTTDGSTPCLKCKNCEVTTAKAVIPATGHKWVDVAAKAATETEDGYTAHKACSVCGEKDESYKVIPKLGGDVRDVNGDGKFTSDDAIALLYLTFGNPDIKYDFNGDGKVTSDDAVTLLYMSF